MKRINFKEELYFHLSGNRKDPDPFQVNPDVVWNLFNIHIQIINEFHQVTPICFVIMPNHFHLLCKFPSLEILEESTHYLKENFSKNIFSANHVCGYSSFFKRRILTYTDFQNLYKYIYRNPVESGLAKRAEEYRYSSLRDILNCKYPTLYKDPFHIIFDEIRVLTWLNHKIQNLYISYPKE